KFPEQQSTALTVTAAKPAALVMRLRVPAWLDSSPTVKINGKTLEVSANPGSYVTIRRIWKSGDRVEMELPMQLRVESMPDDPKMQTFLYGPLVLAGDLGAEGLTPAMIVGPNAPRIAKAGMPAASNGVRLPEIEIPAFRAASADPASWIKPADRALVFRTTG